MIKPSNSPTYFEVDEFEVVSRDLTTFAALLSSNDYKEINWKWVLIVAHNVLQGACVCILTDSAGLGALKEDPQKEVIEAYNSDLSKLGSIDQRLAPLSKLLCRLPDELLMKIKGMEPPYPYDQKGDIKRLYEYRDSFMHFIPRSWSIEIAGMLRILEHTFLLVADIVKSEKYANRNRFAEYPVAQQIAVIKQQILELKCEAAR